MSSAALALEGVHAGYGRLEVLHGIDLTVEPGTITTLLGANGSGKSTLLRAIAGVIRPRGSITLFGSSIVGVGPEGILRRGASLVPEGRGTFPNLTVDENLRVGATTRSARTVAAHRDRWFDTFPRLRERRAQLAGTLSGGEQQMLAVARAMMSEPRLLLLDEPSMGLAPNITQQLFATLQQINDETGVTMLIVEQNANLALGIASHAYVIETGRIVLSGPSAQLSDDQRVQQAYLHV